MGAVEDYENQIIYTFKLNDFSQPYMVDMAEHCAMVVMKYNV